jgi:hypothetical protein
MTLFDVEANRRIVAPMTETDADCFIQKYIVDDNVTLVGLDCEWKTRWAKYDVAVIQIVTDNLVFLFQTSRFRNESRLPLKLAEILMDRNIVKVGVNIEEDAWRINRQFLISVGPWLDLRCFGIKYSLLGECLLQQLQDHELLLLGKKESSTADKKSKRTSFMPKLGLETLVAMC